MVVLCQSLQSCLLENGCILSETQSRDKRSEHLILLIKIYIFIYIQM